MTTTSNDIRIPAFATITKHLDSDLSTSNDSPVKLVLNGHTIHSLRELRENFNTEELMKYHTEGKLEKWLEQHYYENETDLIKEIDCNQTGCLKKICLALGIDYTSATDMTEEEKAKWEEKKRIVSEYTNDDKILSEIWLVAMNQEELAELLDSQTKKIYLCKDSFYIPIKVPGVQYIGIANATIENPFTQAQYEKAGIKISGFTLPTEENPATSNNAKEAAISNGYDDFPDSHTSLASIYHKQLKSKELINTHHISVKTSFASEFYNSREECENARQYCLQKVYNEAEAYFNPINSKSLAKEAANLYSQKIRSAFEHTKSSLEILSTFTKTSEQYNQLAEKIDNCYKFLLFEFDKELEQNADYYNMYNFDYFMGLVDIEEYSYRTSDSLLSQFFNNAYKKVVKYRLSGICPAIREIEADMNTRVGTFFASAFNIYKSYILEIEQLLDEIGKGFPATEGNETPQIYINRCCEYLAQKAHS